MGQRRCKSCRFFEATKTLAEWQLKICAKEGECHRFPPVWDRKSDYLGVFPIVSADDDWCGEHKLRDEVEQ